MGAQVFFNYKNGLGNPGAGSDVHLVNDDIKVILVDANYIFDSDTQFNLDDIVDEISGTGYTAGGKSLVNKSLTADTAASRTIYYADDAVWNNSTLVAYGAITYKNTGLPATSKLITYHDFGGIKSTSNETFKIKWNAEGILYFT